MQERVATTDLDLKLQRIWRPSLTRYSSGKVFAGFTLIELMIVIAIISLLAMIAAPSYLEYIRQARRIEAQASLIDLQRAIEKYRVNSPTYANCVSSGACVLPTSDYYIFSLADADVTSYRLNAAAQRTQVADATCTPLTLDENGTKGPTGCWKQ